MTPLWFRATAATGDAAVLDAPARKTADRNDLPANAPDPHPYPDQTPPVSRHLFDLAFDPASARANTDPRCSPFVQERADVCPDAAPDAAPSCDPNKGTRRVALPQFHQGISDAEMDAIVDKATTASNFLKAVSHEGRLLILCHLVSGEKSVTELEDLLSARQAAVSQQLSRLRLEGLVVPRRDGKAIYYRLADDRPARIIELVYELFCNDGTTA